MDGILFCGVCGKTCEEHEFLSRRDTKAKTLRKVCKMCRRERHLRRVSVGSKCRLDNSSFWDRVNKNGPIMYPHLGVCWVWEAGRLEKGYGVWRTPNNSYRSMLAHRFVWTITYGEIPEETLVLHKCDNPPCVNPSHLFLGSYVDNMQDCIRKGRFVVGKRSKGEECPRSKITEEHVREIRRLRQSGLLLREIAAQLQLSLPNISQVLTGRTWRHVQ